MKKIKVFLALLIVLMLSSCKIESKIKNEFFSETTLQKYKLENLPKGNWKDCVVWGSFLYFNIEREEFENWILSVGGYINSREDIIERSLDRLTYFNQLNTIKLDVSNLYPLKK